MDGARIQAKVYDGYAKAAARVGRSYTQFRPALTASPLNPLVQIGTIKAAMTPLASGFNFNRPATDTTLAFNCLADGALLQIGDVLSDEATAETFFVGAMEQLTPIVAIRCNAVVSVSKRAAGALAPGLNAYQGPTLGSETHAFAGLPAAILMVSAGRTTHSGELPADAPGPLKYEIHLFPTLDPTMVSLNDMVTDANGRRFMAAGFERTPISYRLDVVHERA